MRGAEASTHRRPCNLVIDQFVTIWHFVCTGPVNCVYPGHDDRRVNEVCLGTTSLPPLPDVSLRRPLANRVPFGFFLLGFHFPSFLHRCRAFGYFTKGSFHAQLFHPPGFEIVTDPRRDEAQTGRE